MQVLIQSRQHIISAKKLVQVDARLGLVKSTDGKAPFLGASLVFCKLHGLYKKIIVAIMKLTKHLPFACVICLFLQ